MREEDTVCVGSYYQPHYNKPIFYFSCKIKEILA